MQLLALLIATCAPALVAAARGPGEICGPYPGGFCEEGLTCASCRPAIPGAPGVCAFKDPWNRHDDDDVWRRW
ncbi:hypothetical protein BDV27DRAFT_161715 [Aspergillus caelatus]|uniref:Uncharacterized protein n=2 Tax=Aspergillus subgen. Circumdati TaxID=2720871 RepID=A0A5N6ZSJ6_9EURO|nr:uncharacterized protein BDV27DRAFT_161715 [Aspergillus caelatus]KAE8360365.1 hypothetical protein BDV27DRAFT_161715 [Aspergillus caelatus]KAE8415277.1 hypothetical protein BDV36DRAFT_298251 [Aspergillus pseudocaelatus]